MNTTLLKVLWRTEVLTWWRTRYACITTIGFYFLVILIFALTLRASPELLTKFAPGIVWTAMLFSLILSFDRLFVDDYQDGVIEQWRVVDRHFNWFVCFKMLMHFLLTAGVLWLFTPLAALLLHLPLTEICILMTSLFLALPAMVILGSLLSSLVLGLRQTGSLLVLLLLPLYVPILLFGVGVVQLVSLSMPFGPALAALGAMSVLSLMLGPVAIVTVLKLVR